MKKLWWPIPLTPFGGGEVDLPDVRHRANTRKVRHAKTKLICRNLKNGHQ